MKKIQLTESQKEDLKVACEVGGMFLVTAMISWLAGYSNGYSQGSLETFNGLCKVIGTAEKVTKTVA